jgi:hypothetical protein
MPKWLGERSAIQSVAAASLTPPACYSGLAMLSEAQRYYSTESNEEQQVYNQNGLHIILMLTL